MVILCGLHGWTPSTCTSMFLKKKTPFIQSTNPTVYLVKSLTKINGIDSCKELKEHMYVHMYIHIYVYVYTYIYIYIYVPMIPKRPRNKASICWKLQSAERVQLYICFSSSLQRQGDIPGFLLFRRTRARVLGCIVGLGPNSASASGAFSGQY